ncbi:hypothetical protein FOA52_015877 [Chlamydomonas sp. UWO 241]|nr:hypothetical protein FOA52_015877 [Chlamydomonas sp. UWO 241]
MLSTKQSVSVRSSAVARRSAVVVKASAGSRREIEDLLASSTANKAINDKKRLATSYANLARSRTVADGSCTVFTNNFFGCEELATKQNKFIAADRAIECEGKEEGKCNNRMTGFSM